MKNLSKAVISIAIPQIVGGISGFFTVSNVTSWYKTEVIKPSWNPPAWVFGPVWTSLYLMMGISLFIVWKSNAPIKQKSGAIWFWSLQMLFNFLWSLIFFGQHQIGWALVDISTLWGFILLTIFAFARINKTAAWLLVPYISWVTFASILNYTIWILN